MRKGVEENSGGVGIVERHRDLARARCGDDGRHVLYLHGHRSGTSTQISAVFSRIRSPSYPPADQRVVRLHRNSEAPQKPGGQFAVWPVSGERNQSMGSGPAVGKIDQRDRRLTNPARRSYDALPRFQRCAHRAPGRSACRRGRSCSRSPSAANRPTRRPGARTGPSSRDRSASPANGSRRAHEHWDV